MAGARGSMTMFELAGRAMSAQMVRMNAAASNLSNAGSISGSEEQAYRPIRAVFAEHLDQKSGFSSVDVRGVLRTNDAPIRQYDPDHPLADRDGNVWISPVDEHGEMVEMMEASRQYQNIIQALTTSKQLMLETMRMK